MLDLHDSLFTSDERSLVVWNSCRDTHNRDTVSCIRNVKF